MSSAASTKKEPTIEQKQVLKNELEQLQAWWNDRMEVWEKASIKKEAVDVMALARSLLQVYKKYTNQPDFRVTKIDNQGRVWHVEKPEHPLFTQTKVSKKDFCAVAGLSKTRINQMYAQAQMSCSDGTLQTILYTIMKQLVESKIPLTYDSREVTNFSLTVGAWPKEVRVPVVMCKQRMLLVVPHKELMLIIQTNKEEKEEEVPQHTILTFSDDQYGMSLRPVGIQTKPVNILEKEVFNNNNIDMRKLIAQLWGNHKNKQNQFPCSRSLERCTSMWDDLVKLI